MSTRRKTALAFLASAVGVGTHHLLYQLYWVPQMRSAEGAPTFWWLSQVLVGATVFVTAALCIEGPAQVAAWSAWTTLVRRLGETAMVYWHMAGYEKFDLLENPWAYWTWMTALEVAFWMLSVSLAKAVLKVSTRFLAARRTLSPHS